MAWFDPDANPIEHLWELIKKKLEDRPCKNLDELTKAIFKAWNSITADVTANLVSSMPQRCAAVIAANGGHTKY